MVACTVTRPGRHPVPDAIWPLAVCNTHSGVEIEIALTNHFPGMEQAEEREED
jgi:hypothetical protein